jgi:thiamine-monophosphate kinase
MSRSVRGEFEIITQIKERCQASPVVQLGIGDDCAILQLPPGELLLSTTDMLIESVHFRRDWTGLLSLGRKSAAVNLSDLAAMGATPRALFLALAIPADLIAEDIDLFFEGFLEVCHDSGAVLAGGDTSSSQAGLSICVTALGSAPATEVVRRSGAKPGDGLYVTGALGDSSLALQWLGEGRALPPELLNRHLEPTARVKAGRALARSGIATAMIDVSDGLLADLGHILKASLVGACIQVDRLPLSSALRATGDEDSRLFDRALTGGEDYELLFTATPESEGKIARIASENSLPITRIGTISMAAEEFVLEYNGNMYPLPLHRGYKHFSDGT